MVSQLQAGLHLEASQYFIVLLMLYPWVEEYGLRPVNAIQKYCSLRKSLHSLEIIFGSPCLQPPGTPS